MENIKKKHNAVELLSGISLFSICYFIFDIASAHEVYVLDSETIRAAMATTSPNTFLAYFGNESQFFFWAFISIVTMLTILFATAFGIFEHSLGPVFSTLRRCALPLARITAGVSVI